MGAFTWIAGRCARIVRSPTAPERAAGLLDTVADRWNCWRLHSETDRQHLFRLQLYLHGLAIAVEEDLHALDDLEHGIHEVE